MGFEPITPVILVQCSTFFKLHSHMTAMVIHLFILSLAVKCMYSETPPYGHLFNTDTSLLRTVHLVPESPKSI